MRIWCKRHPIQFMALYLVFYLAFFTALEKNVRPVYLIHCPLDDLIPFVPFAIIPYYLWFAWIVGTLFWLLWFAPKAEFWRLCLPLFAGMTLSLTICALLPNGIELRPDAVPGADVCSALVRLLYAADTSTNVCPSIHVFNSVTLDLAYQRSSMLSGRKYGRVKLAAHLLDVSIILSTMLLKQHSVIDVVCGIALALALDHVANALSVARDHLPQEAPLFWRAFARRKSSYERD